MLSEVILNGIVVGGIYSISALGFAMIYRASHVMNFAHGELLMFGAYLALSARLSLGLGYFWSLTVAALGTAAIAFAIERHVISRLSARTPDAAIIATLAIGIILAELVKLIWGPVIYPMPTPFGKETVKLGQIVLSVRELGILFIAITVTCILAIFMKFSRTGIAIRAAAHNATIASLTGVRVRQLQSAVWALSGALAAVAGVLIASVTAVSPSLHMIILSIFASAIIGGLNNLAGAAAGGIFLGVLQTMVGFYVSSALTDICTFSLLIAVLLLRPQGLFGFGRGRLV